MKVEERIEQLEKELKDLKKDRLAMFGRTYSQIGDSKSDLVLNTRGLVKVKYGNKFIDLLKNGKINVDNEFIFIASDVQNLGSKDGIYILDDESICIKYKGKTVNVSGVSECLSLKENLEVTSEQKLAALLNIGFYYPDLESAKEILNGLVYVLTDGNLYKIQEGVPTLYILQTSELEIVDNKTENNTEESIEEIPYRISNGIVEFLKPIRFKTASTFNANLDENGLYIYEDANDKVIVQADKFITTTPTYNMLTWDEKSNIIQVVNLVFDETTSEVTDTFNIQFVFKNEYKQADKISVYTYYTNEDINIPCKLELEVQSTADYITVKNLTQFESNVFKLEALQHLENAYTFIKLDSDVVGLILLYKGSTAPDGWKLCDGTLGTINLQDNFIKDTEGNIIACYIVK